MLADAAMFCAAEPAEAKRAEIAARWRLAKQRSIAVAVRLAEGVPASGERNGFFRIHSHAQEGRLHVTRRKQRIGIAAGTFRIDVDQTHLYRCERSVEFVKAARALGLSNAQIIRRHVLPNSLTPVITFLPFRMSAAILALTSLDFLGLGVPASVPSLGELLQQGKANLDAWWIILPTFALLTVTMLLLTFIGDALRDAFDTRKS